MPFIAIEKNNHSKIKRSYSLPLKYKILQLQSGLPIYVYNVYIFLSLYGYTVISFSNIVIPKTKN